MYLFTAWTVLYQAATIVWSAWAIVTRKRTVKILLLSCRFLSFSYQCWIQHQLTVAKLKKRAIKLPFFLSRAGTAAKHKTQTEVARAEQCKRRLFTSETEKENITRSDEPCILCQRSREMQNNDEMVSINCGDLSFYRHLFWGCLKKKYNKSGHKILFISTAPWFSRKQQDQRTIRIYDHWSWFLATVIKIMASLQNW